MNFIFFMPFSVPEQGNYFKETSDGARGGRRTSLIFFFISCSSTEQSNYFKDMSVGLDVAGGRV